MKKHTKTKTTSKSKSKSSNNRQSTNDAAPSASSIEREPNPVKRFLKIIGPGFITGASDDDPSGIGTYSVAGAQFGFSTLWTAVITFPLMAVVQYVCGKIGMVTGRGLAGALGQYYSPWLLYPAVSGLMIANMINAGADIGAIAAAINMLLPIPITIMIVPIAVIILAVQLSASYRVVNRIFKWLTLALFAYIGSAVLAKPDLIEVLKGTFIPTFSFDSKFLATLVAIFGTTISPYMFFWQPTQGVEEEISQGRTTIPQRKGASDKEVQYLKWDTTIGMFFSNLVMYFIILGTGATLFQAGKTDIESAIDAAQALRPLAGDASSILFALGLIGTGLLAVPILTGSASYAVMETFGWKRGLGKKLHKAKAFYIVICISTLIGLLINFIGINPIDALFWTAVINGFLAPPLLVMIMVMCVNKKLMGRHVSSLGVSIMGWLTTLIMFVAAAALVITWGK